MKTEKRKFPDVQIGERFKFGPWLLMKTEHEERSSNDSFDSFCKCLIMEGPKTGYFYSLYGIEHIFVDCILPEQEPPFEAELEKFERDGYFWETEARMRAVHGVMSRWAPEMVVVQDGKILLVRYDGGIEEFKGMWHIPGGYDRPSDRATFFANSRELWGFKSIGAVVERNAVRELGVSVRLDQLVDLFWWHRQRSKTELLDDEHPYGWPLSIYVKCTPLGLIVENENRKWFSFYNLSHFLPNSPDKVSMVEPHRHFLLNHRELFSSSREEALLAAAQHFEYL